MPGEEKDPLNETMNGLLAEMKKITAQEEAGGKTETTVKAKADAAAALTEEQGKLSKKERKAAKAKAADLAAEQDERFRRLIRDELHGTRSAPATFGKGKPIEDRGRRKASPILRAHPFFKAAFRDYTPGDFVAALAQYRGMSVDGVDPVAIMAGKAVLQSLAEYQDKPEGSKGSIYVNGPMVGKATLGTTGATGGFVLPNNLVDSVAKPSVQDATYGRLCTVRNGVAVRGVDQPYRTGAPARAQFSNWGATKDNRNEAYGSYTATLGTMALIYDVGKQYLRFSAGSAEEDVMDELAKAHALGENFAVIAGPGTGSATPGVNDPTVGVYTALSAGGFQSAWTAGATFLLSAHNGLTTLLSALAHRSRHADGIVVDAVTYWGILSQGTDAAGAFVPTVASNTIPSGFNMSPDGTLRFYNVPIYTDSNLDANTGQAGIAIAGEWKQLKLYRGTEFRIDTSDQAGTRWDQNLVGFRGEQEFGINAGTAVAVGAFQFLTGLVP